MISIISFFETTRRFSAFDGVPILFTTELHVQREIIDRFLNGTSTATFSITHPSSTR